MEGKPKRKNLESLLPKPEVCKIMLWNESELYFDQVLCLYKLQKEEDVHPPIVAVAENGKPRTVSSNVE